MNKIVAIWRTNIMVPCDANIPIWRHEILNQFNSFKEIKGFVSNEFYIQIGSRIQIDALRTLVIEKKLTEDELVFEFNNIKIYPNSNSRLDNWPNGFGDLDDQYLEKLLCYEG